MSNWQRYVEQLATKLGITIDDAEHEAASAYSEHVHTGRYSEEEIARADHENDQAKDERLTGDR